MSVYTIRPLEDRTGFTGKSKPSQFDSWWSDTRELLAKEVRMLSGKNVILEVDVLPSMIRLDGELYANAKALSPAVRLHFDSKHGHITYATDAFSTWQDNVRAIALALEALRKVDRYGIGRGGEQYRGYLALEAGSGATALGAEPAMTEAEAHSVLDEAAGGGTLGLTWTVIYKRARAGAHPDRHAGDRAAWDQVEKAAKVLGLL